MNWKKQISIRICGNNDPKEPVPDICVVHKIGDGFQMGDFPKTVLDKDNPWIEVQKLGHITEARGNNSMV